MIVTERDKDDNGNFFIGMINALPFAFFSWALLIVIAFLLASIF